MLPCVLLNRCALIWVLVAATRNSGTRPWGLGMDEVEKQATIQSIAGEHNQPTLQTASPLTVFQLLCGQHLHTLIKRGTRHIHRSNDIPTFKIIIPHVHYSHPALRLLLTLGLLLEQSLGKRVCGYVSVRRRERHCADASTQRSGHVKPVIDLHRFLNNVLWLQLAEHSQRRSNQVRAGGPVSPFRVLTCLDAAGLGRAWWAC